MKIITPNVRSICLTRENPLTREIQTQFNQLDLHKLVSKQTMQQHRVLSRPFDFK